MTATSSPAVSAIIAAATVCGRPGYTPAVLAQIVQLLHTLSIAPPAPTAPQESKHAHNGYHD